MPKRVHKYASPSPLINKLIFIVAIVQPLATIPQIAVIYSNQDASGVSLLSWFIFIVFDFMWLWYGIVDKQRAVIVSAVLFAVLDGAVTAGGFMYGATW